MNLKEQRAAALKAAQDILASAKGREITSNEESAVQARFAEIEDLDKKIAAGSAAKGRFEQLASLGGVLHGESAPMTGASGFLKFDRAAMAKQMMRDDDGQPRGIKALVQTGTSVAAETMVQESPVQLGQPATSLLEVIPVQTVNRDYSYLQQTGRTNNAAMVAVGDLKPTSVYTIGRVEDRLRVLAHLSEGIDKYWLEDNTSLGNFIASELLYGLYLKLVDQVVNGPGTGENLRGIANTSGIQAQPFVTNPLLTIRTAINQVELVGYAPAAIVLHPNDWLKIETTTVTSGEYLFGDAGAPIDRVSRRLWGVPVVLANAMTVGTSLILSQGAVSLYTDGSGVRVEWAVVGDDFSRNQIRARCEARFGFGVQAPLGVVKAALVSA